MPATEKAIRTRPARSFRSPTPIYTAASYFYESTAKLDRVLGREEEGFCYARYDNPTNAALEELIGNARKRRRAHWPALPECCRAHGFARRSHGPPQIHSVAASALYGATTSLLNKVLEPLGIEINFVDICDLDQVRRSHRRIKPGCVLMETISNPLLRVGAMDASPKHRARRRRRAGGGQHLRHALLVRPLELGAHMSVHSADQVSGRPRRRPGRRQ